ncbi:MAG TPA: phosphate ABC transporter permease PstA [Candidatus Saccharimonadales bacterium]|jgi:phosphate transport system permease protein|nr:phosphate ABC transporter permease PstA [Candidatus Saccharimonadales bacterium]
MSDSQLLRGTALRRRSFDRFISVLCLVAGVIALLPLAAVIAFLLIEGLKAWSPAFLVERPGSVVGPGGGAVHAIIGTFLMTGLALVIATPAALAVAVYVVEYRESRLAVVVRSAVDLLAGVPSIVVGIIVYALVVLTMKHFSGFAGSLALAIIMLPIIARTSEEMLKIVPRRLREGTMALGMARWRALGFVFIPTVASGILTGILLAVSRAIGETAPLLFTSLGSNFVQTDFSQPMSALPVYIFQNAINIGFPAAKERAWAGALTLVTIVLVLNLLGRWLASRAAVRGAN